MAKGRGKGTRKAVATNAGTIAENQENQENQVEQPAAENQVEPDTDTEITENTEMDMDDDTGMDDGADTIVVDENPAANPLTKVGEPTTEEVANCVKAFLAETARVYKTPMRARGAKWTMDRIKFGYWLPTTDPHGVPCSYNLPRTLSDLFGWSPRVLSRALCYAHTHHLLRVDGAVWGKVDEQVTDIMTARRSGMTEPIAFSDITISDNRCKRGSKKAAPMFVSSGLHTLLQEELHPTGDATDTATEAQGERLQA